MDFKNLVSDLYSIRDSYDCKASILFVDFKYLDMNTRTNNGALKAISIGPDVFTKSFQLGKLEIEDETIESLTKNLDRLFIEKANELGKKHRIFLSLKEERKKKLEQITSGKPMKGDFDIDNFNYAPKHIRQIQNLIATRGRIGPGNYIILNKKTFDYMSARMPEPISIKYHVNDCVPDNTCIMGRLNSIDQPGISCVIQTTLQIPRDLSKDVPNRIIYNDGKVNASIIDIGFYSHFQYYTFYIL